MATTEKKLRLFELPAEWQAFSDLLDECGEELTEEQAAAFTEFEAKILGSEAGNLDYYLELIDKRKFHGAAAKEYEEIYKRQRQADENAVERLRGFIKMVLVQSNRIIAKSDNAPARKIETPKGRTISIQNAGGPISFEVVETEEIPNEYLIPQPAKLDNDKVRADLKAGKSLPFVKVKPKELTMVIR